MVVWSVSSFSTILVINLTTLVWRILPVWIPASMSLIQYTGEIGLRSSETLPSIQVGRHSSLFIHCKSHVVIINGLGEIASFVLTSTSRVCCIDMVWIDIQNGCEIFNTFIDIFLLFISAPPHVVSTCIRIIKFHESVAIFDGSLEISFLEIAWSSNE